MNNVLPVRHRKIYRKLLSLWRDYCGFGALPSENRWAANTSVETPPGKDKIVGIHMEDSMKRTALNMMLTLVCTAILAAAAVAAMGPNLMAANIPFDFHIGSHALPAGTYTVSRGGSPNVWIFRNEKTAESAAVLTHLGAGRILNTKAQLDFHRYGDQYFLSALKQAQTANCFTTPKSKREREVANDAKNLARQQTGPELVTITAE